MDDYYEGPNGKIHRTTDGHPKCGRPLTGLTPIAADEVGRIKRRKNAATRLCAKCFPRKAS